MPVNVDKKDCLVIDEVSMISAKMLETVGAVCRILFGGFQVLLCGDFSQLPPVCNLQDPGKYCFQSKIFHEVFHQVVILHEVTRTNDHRLSKTLSEFFQGKYLE